jgi:hypothetical protein
MMINVVDNESIRCLELERSNRDKEGPSPASLSCINSTGDGGSKVKKGKSVSFGKVKCFEFARTVGDNEVIGPVPLSLDNEVLSIMVVSVDQYEDCRAPLRKNRKEDFLLTPQERLAALDRCGVAQSQIYLLEKERLNRLKEDWSPHLEEMGRNYPTKHEGPQGIRQKLKRSGPTWSAIRRGISLRSAKKNMRGLINKLRATFRRARRQGRKATLGPRLPVNGHVPKVNASASRGLEALALAQSADLPTALNLTFKWEKVVVEGASGVFVCCTCFLESCVVSRVVRRI